ncbi:thioredoxin-like protein [Massarina eburnea CBS 473.64]|uniref:Thioredoxin-like protein n=1 Tax=Massarina eburnea CBS 473.64 TaxID=1395130 RepID=A0A6A6RNN8_9PLEO|nr:thioredoxin-like protein [Massarina eburnea CBS 473.64]
MRRSIFYSLLSLATIATTYAAPTAEPKDDDDFEDKVSDTIFNGQTVPPMIELGTDLEEKTKTGHWLVEFFSPQCPHCMQFKPTWQTLYEFYYTTKPLITKQDNDDDTLNSFTRYYDFKFAKVNCLAFRDACVDHEINNYPSILQIEDGKEIKRMKGVQDLEVLSGWVEEILETIRPGLRVKGGIKLPQVGANSVETTPDTKDKAEEKGAEAAKQSSKSAVAEATLSKASNPTAAKATPTANPSGVSLSLTPETFQDMVTNTNEPWFIKFYAPWCHHCQAMAPNWLQMAREMKGKLNIGEVNCEAEKHLCKDAGVKGYPSLLFFRGGERIEYHGMRGLGDLIDYAKNAVAISSGVADVNLAEFKKLEEDNEVIFVYFYDHATTSEDFQALERLTLSLVGKARLVKTNDAAMFERFKVSTWPRLVVSRDTKPTYYTPISPKDMRDVKKVLTWMKSVWLPIVPELKTDNARQIMDGKLVVLAILNRDRKDDFATGRRELKNAALEWIDKEEQMFQLERQELRDAKQLRIEEAEDKNDQRALRAAKQIHVDMNQVERRQVGFAWVDGIFWERWIRTTFGIDVKDGEKVVINDEDNHRYWDNTISGEPIRPSRASILETITKVTKNQSTISPKYTHGAFKSFFLGIQNFFTGHPIIAVGMVIGLIVAGSMVTKRGRRGGYFQVGEKDGLLGGNGLGKTD